MPLIKEQNFAHDKIYIGIDPGKNGGLVALNQVEVFSALRMPETEKDIWDWFAHWSSTDFLTDQKIIAVIEQVSGHIGKDQPGSAMFNFGWGYGGLRMALIGNNIPSEDAPPQRWMKALKIPSRKKHTGTQKVQLTRGKNKGKWVTRKCGGETDTEWKNRLKAIAQRLFPSEKVTNATADALLIATYCMRKDLGNL